jgi:hypothetical protein
VVFLDGYNESGNRERGTRILLEQLDGALQSYLLRPAPAC